MGKVPTFALLHASLETVGDDATAGQSKGKGLTVLRETLQTVWVKEAGPWSRPCIFCRFS